MTKTKLIKDLANANDLSQRDANKIAEDFLRSLLTAVLKDGESITFRGLGTFSFAHSKARKGRNPQTGESIDIPARNRVKFKLAKSF